MKNFKNALTRLQEESDKIQKTEEFYAANDQAVTDVLEQLIIDLKRVKLSLNEDSVSIRKTGLTDYLEDGDKITISFTAAGCSGFKFIKPQGYTARGDGRNQKRLEAKATKIKGALKTDAMQEIGVNQFSLEAKEEEEKTSRVMVTVWI